MNFTEIFLSDGTISPTLMLWIFYIAVVIGTIVYYLTNAQMYQLVSRLLEIGANSPETAVALYQAEIKPGFLLMRALKSPSSYKDLLVAITYDGKYYTNYTYTSEPPTIRELKAITRIRKSKIKEISSENETDLSANDVDVIQESPELKNSEVTENTAENAAVYTEFTPQKVKFDPTLAKFYIPKEAQDKTKNLFKSPKVKLWHLILLILGFAVVTFLATLALDTYIEMFSVLGD